MKEAICSVIFASPRCADIPELMDVRKMFTSKYGKDFVSAAVELRPDCGVSRLVRSFRICNSLIFEICKKLFGHSLKWAS